MIDIEAGQFVKICGLRTDEAARAAALAGADALGFILAESRRRVGLDFVRETRRALLSEVDRIPAVVGVTVNAAAAEIDRIVTVAEVDAVQLSGDESPSLLDAIEVPVIKTVHVAAGMDLDALERAVDRWFDHPSSVVAILIDAKVAGAYGGSGMQSDWTVAAHLAARYPAILAGGLKPGNVMEGIQTVGPRGVDVSSGVEIAGEKDLTLIEAFVVKARQGYAGTDESVVIH
jgi:phosphoribosylanthranilate isomerase